MNTLTKPELKRYCGRVKLPSGELFGNYVDWFTDDDDALASYRVIMEEQGYRVKSVTIEAGAAIVEIFP